MTGGAADPWTLVAGLVIGLVSLIAWGVRLLARGRLIQGVIYDDVRAQRDKAIAINQEYAEQMGRLVDTVERLVKAQEETEMLIRSVVSMTSVVTPRQGSDT